MPFVSLGCTEGVRRHRVDRVSRFPLNPFGGHRHNDTEAGENDF